MNHHPSTNLCFTLTVNATELNRQALARRWHAHANRRTWLATILALTLGTLTLSGCAPSPDSGGVTTGGQKDIAAARAAIDRGEIPDPESITVEGFLSEHSIPVDLPENPGLLYMTASVAWNRDYDEFTPLATIQVGFGTTLDLSTFQRSHQNLCLVIDLSGSMNEPVDPRSGTTRLDAVKVAIDRLLGNLTINDRVSIVTFSDEVRVVLEPVFGNNIAAIKTALNGLQAGGGTNLAAGMRRGYQLLEANPVVARADRLLVFTDALLNNSAASEVQALISVMNLYANRGYGATLFGIGTDFGDEIANDISQVPGGNYYFLSDYERIITVFDEEFDFLVSPIAYHVHLTIDVPFAFDPVDVYGLPVDRESIPNVITLHLPALFLSHRQGGGAILARLRAGSLVNFNRENLLGRLSLTYRTLDGQQVTHSDILAVLPAGLDRNANRSYFQSDAAKRTALLLNTALVMKRACEDATYDCVCRGRFGPCQCTDYDPGRAITRLTEFLPYFDSLAEGLEDRVNETSRSLSQERAMVVKLLDNITNRRR